LWQGTTEVKKVEEEKKKPMYKFDAGSIKVAVWLNEIKTDAGQDIALQTVTIKKSYKAKDGSWKDSNSFAVAELPKVILCLQEAFKACSMRL
jgi:hypothetical protein